MPRYHGRSRGAEARIKTWKLLCPAYTPFWNTIVRPAPGIPFASCVYFFSLFLILFLLGILFLAIPATRTAIATALVERKLLENCLFWSERSLFLSLSLKSKSLQPSRAVYPAVPRCNAGGESYPHKKECRALWRMVENE